MTGITFDDITTPYSKKFEEGQTYEWPSIPYMTAMRGCLRLTCCDGGTFIGQTYRGDPWMNFPTDSVLLNMMASQPMFRVETCSEIAQSEPRFDIAAKGIELGGLPTGRPEEEAGQWKLVRADTYFPVIRKGYEKKNGTVVEPRYGPETIRKGGTVYYERLVPV